MQIIFITYSFSGITKLCNRPVVFSNHGRATNRPMTLQSPFLGIFLRGFPKTS